MKELADDHRGHTIITTVSGPIINSEPFVASYSVWKIEKNNSYRAVIQGSLSNIFQSSESARVAAVLEAKEKLDEIIDAK